MPRKIPTWLIEDNETFRDVLVDGLRVTNEFIPTSFGSCEEAFEALAQGAEPPEVILLDIKLPGISGIRAIPQLKQKAPESKIIILTINEDDLNIKRAMVEGADGYVVKTAGLKELFNAMRSALDGQRH